MKIIPVVFSVLSVLLMTGMQPVLAAAAPDQQEAICADPAVIFCENFEDRSTADYMDMSRPKYKNNGWALSNASSGNQTEKVVNTQAVDGSKGFQFQYNPGSNGAGFLDTSVAGGSDVYIRWYSKWSTNYVWSGVSTKHFEYALSAGNPGNIHLWSSNWGSNELHHNTNNATFQRVVDQNVSPLFTVQPNTWACLEVHIKMNSGLGSSNGVIEGWVDGVKRMNYPAIEVWNAAAVVNGLMMSGYWNCAQPPSDCSTAGDYKSTMYRWHDNIVMSTQRVGCLGTPPAGGDTLVPAKPSGLRLL